MDGPHGEGRKQMLLCRHCIEEIKSKGDYLLIGEMLHTIEESEAEGIKCEWCEEYDDLYEVIAHDSLY